MAESSKNTHRNWLDLPDDITTSILSRLDAVQILEKTQRVCMAWRRICKHNPTVWRTIRICNHPYLDFQSMLYMCCHIVDLSCGNLVDISIKNLNPGCLLNYITNNCRGIKRLSIVEVSKTPKELSAVASKLPLLEDLEFSYWRHSLTSDLIECDDCGEIEFPYCPSTFGGSYLAVIGRGCPVLKSLKLNKYYKRGLFPKSTDGDKDAFAIAKTMHGLQNLQLFGNNLTMKGLQAILDGCPLLESIDLRRCLGIELTPYKLERFCSGRNINTLLHPFDPEDDYEHLAIHKTLIAIEQCYPNRNDSFFR